MKLEKYIENKFYDKIFEKISNYVIRNRENIKEDIASKRNNFRKIRYVKLEGFYIRRYSVVESRENIITLSVIRLVNI